MIKKMFNIVNSVSQYRILYAFTRHETEKLIIAFSGEKAMIKKAVTVNCVRKLVLAGSFEKAQNLAAHWDGVTALQNMRFRDSLPHKLLRRKDIAQFLGIDCDNEKNGIYTGYSY